MTRIRKARYLQLTRMEVFSHLKTYTTQMAEQDTKGDKTCSSDAGCVSTKTDSKFIHLFVKTGPQVIGYIIAGFIL